MSTADRLGIIAAFEAAWQRKATSEKMERLQCVQHVFLVRLTKTSRHSANK